MEANEAGELQEHAEHGAHEPSMRPVAFTMALLAALVAIVTVVGHRTHTEAVLDQNKVTDLWNFYQAKNIRATVTKQVSNELSVMTITSDKQAAADKIVKDNAEKLDKWAGDLEKEKQEAEALEKKVEQAEARANRFDFGEALLEIALVISSITLLTKNRLYWFLGLIFGAGGILVSASVLLLQ